VDLSHNNISFAAAGCLDPTGRGAEALHLDLSGNPWGVDLQRAVPCILGGGSPTGLAELYLDDMGLTGVAVASLWVAQRSRLSLLSLRRNALRVGQDTYSFGFGGAFSILLGDNAGLQGQLSLRLFAPRPVIDIDRTGVKYCYDVNRLLDPGAVSRSLRGVRPATLCNRAVEASAAVGFFERQCEAATAASVGSGTLSLTSLYCRSPTSEVAFVDSALVCPSWSTFASGGRVALNVDAAFLGFWGCVCPPDQFWGYAANGASAAMDAEASSIAAGHGSLGALEAALQPRRCLPCPRGMECSRIAVREAPHRLRGSIYPRLPSGFPRAADGVSAGVPRALFPYTVLLPCLHPTVCNHEPDALDLAAAGSDWAAWASLAAANVTSTPGFAQFLCRPGHDVDSPQCSACVADYWSNGFICERCGTAYAVLVPLALLGGLAALALHVRHRVRVVEQWRRTVAASAERRSMETHSVAVVLSFLQVSATLQISAQINAAQSAVSGNGASRNGAGEVASGPGSGWLDELLSFRPWAAECVLGVGWNFTTSSGLLLALPWLVAIVALIVGQRLSGSASAAVQARTAAAACVLLDMLYLPVVTRSIVWFNVAHVQPVGQVSGHHVAHCSQSPVVLFLCALHA
jgi:hypothetical protein